MQETTRWTKPGEAITSTTGVQVENFWASELGNRLMVYFPHVARQLGKGAPVRIVAFGSSSTEGIGASSPSAAYPAVLQRDLDDMRPDARFIVLNRGVGGEDANSLLKRINRDALSLKPDLVIWQTGTNDALTQAPLARFKEETRAAMVKLKGADMDIMLMEPQWCPVLDDLPGSLAYRDAVREIGVESDVPVIRRFDLMHAWFAGNKVKFDDLFAPDRLHMTDGGYAMLARHVAGVILEGAGGDAPRALSQCDQPA